MSWPAGSDGQSPLIGELPEASDGTGRSQRLRRRGDQCVGSQAVRCAPVGRQVGVGARHPEGRT